MATTKKPITAAMYRKEFEKLPNRLRYYADWIEKSFERNGHAEAQIIFQLRADAQVLEKWAKPYVEYHDD